MTVCFQVQIIMACATNKHNEQLICLGYSLKSEKDVRKTHGAVNDGHYDYRKSVASVPYSSVCGNNHIIVMAGRFRYVVEQR